MPAKVHYDEFNISDKESARNIIEKNLQYRSDVDRFVIQELVTNLVEHGNGESKIQINGKKIRAVQNGGNFNSFKESLNAVGPQIVNKHVGLTMITLLGWNICIRKIKNQIVILCKRTFHDHKQEISSNHGEGRAQVKENFI